MSVLTTACVRQKIREIESACHDALLGRNLEVPLMPARDLEVRGFRDLPPKEGLSQARGRARLLHDMGSIELQAMELALRNLRDYPDAPESFRQELAALAISEAQHLEMCLNGVEELGFKWGDWPAHLSLWTAVEASDSLIDRVLIVHRYLEGSGLDAGDKLLRRLNGLTSQDVTFPVISRIHREEIDHVDFGSRWYRELCRREKLDPGDDFAPRMMSLRRRLPYRTEQLAVESRLKAGFTMKEIQEIELWRASIPAATAPDSVSAKSR